MAERFNARSAAALFTAAVAACGSAARARAAVPVEQVEAYETGDPGDPPNLMTRYSPVPFTPGVPTTTTGPGDQGGVFPNITFHAVPSSATTNANSNHAYAVGTYFYGTSSPASGSVANVYATSFSNFVTSDLIGLTAPNSAGPVPPGFDGGALVINNSYVSTENPPYPNADIDFQRRIDFSVAKNDVTFVAAAVTGVAGLNDPNGTPYYFDLVWSSFNGIAVGGQQSFRPTQTFATTASKTHADLAIPFQDASFAAAITSGYAAALIAAAQTAGQTDANRGIVVRSLLMAGADKVYPGQLAYVRQTANNLDTTRGAGIPDYARSLSILNGGEKPLATVTAGSAAGTPATTSRGWAEGVVAASTQSVLLIQSANAITGLTASLNWDVTQAQNTSAGTIDTTNAGVNFPVLSFQLVPVTFSGGRYVLGAAQTDATLRSAVTTDNVQYLYSTGTLAAGTYALLVTGDTTGKSPNVGISYLLAGTFASNWALSTGGSWGVPADWTNGVPNAQAAVANFASSPGLTGPGIVTLDGNRTVGRLSFNNTNGYTITPGTGGALTIDDAGASTGPAPSITVSAGSHVVTAPVALAAGVAVTTATNTALSLTGGITGTGGLTKAGPGTLTLTGADNYGLTTVTAGRLVVGPSATLGGDLTVTGGTATFAATTGTTVLAHPAGNLTVTGGTVALAASTPRGVLIATTLSLGPATPTGQIDLANGDLIVRNGNLTALTAAAAAGYALGTFAGPGITSTAAAADPTHITAVGVVQNATAAGTALFPATFDGQPVTTTDVLAKYTYYGDANLDGVVNGADYVRLDAGFAAAKTASPLTGWYNGDFNYDGKVDGSDYTLIDNAFNLQRGAVSPSVTVATSQAEIAQATAAVPEPATVGLLAIVTAGLFGPRRRRSRA